MDKYFKIQKIVELQKTRKGKIESILLEVFGFLPKFDLDFISRERINFKNTIQNPDSICFEVRIKIIDRSSIRFVVNQNKQKILEEYSKIFMEDVLVVN